MNRQELEAALERLVQDGMLVRDEDGNYWPTEKGRLVAKNVSEN